LIVTNAGGNFFSVYEPRRCHFGLKWNHLPPHKRLLVTTKPANALNKMEGCPKGLAVHGNTIAACSPEIRIKLYSFQKT
jgi:hypothetical protein